MRVLFRDGTDELVAGEVVYATATRDLAWILFDREGEGNVEGLYLELSSRDDNGNSDCCDDSNRLYCLCLCKKTAGRNER